MVGGVTWGEGIRDMGRGCAWRRGRVGLADC